MKISYAITVCNELEEIQLLIPFLIKSKRPQDEIVVLWDDTGDKKVHEYLLSFDINDFVYIHNSFRRHFAEWKNSLTKSCSGDYIFQIDADEIPTEFLITNLPPLLEDNPELEVLLVPRENYVTGITQEHINKWGWKVDEKQRINWPDLQWRIYKNIPEIKWINKVHERLDGFKNFSNLPIETEWSLNHTKNIKRQEKQNNYYNEL